MEGGGGGGQASVENSTNLLVFLFNPSLMVIYRWHPTKLDIPGISWYCLIQIFVIKVLTICKCLLIYVHITLIIKSFIFTGHKILCCFITFLCYITKFWKQYNVSLFLMSTLNTHFMTRSLKCDTFIIFVRHR